MIDTLKPLLDVGIQLLGLVLLSCGSWAIAHFVGRLKLDKDAAVRGYLEDALRNGVAYAVMQGRLRTGLVAGTPANWHVVMQDAAAYVMARVPDALAKFGVDSRSLEDMVWSRLQVMVPDAASTRQPDPVPEVTSTNEAEPSAGAVPALPAGDPSRIPGLGIYAAVSLALAGLGLGACAYVTPAERQAVTAHALVCAVDAAGRLASAAAAGTPAADAIAGTGQAILVDGACQAAVIAAVAAAATPQ